MSESVDRVAIRRTVRQTVTDGDAISWADLKDAVAEQQDVPVDVVREELVELEKRGFIYTIGEDDAAEVRLP